MTDIKPTFTPAKRPGSDRGGRNGDRAGQDRGGNRGGDNRRRDNRRGGEKREPREFEQKILDLARVTRVTKGGKRMRFRACLIIGDRKGQVGMGIAKGGDVAAAVEKAFRQAKKHLIVVPIAKETIPHNIASKFGAAEIILKPAPLGTGLKCGGAVRTVLELAGVPNAVSKIKGSNNKINNARATFLALKSLKPRIAAPKAIAKASVAVAEETVA
ncbi:MAG: 30S ribosomal protein S5 [Patescibacteria group bacterium]|jgi:small subunit ribosomal protein S5